MSASIRFWNLLARRYSRMPIRDEAAYQEKLQMTQEHLQPDWQVLEFGCGTGSTALTHAAHVAEIRAIDASPNMIEIARDKAAASGVTNVRFDCADFAATDMAPEALDAVLAMSILHLMDDPDTALARVFSGLRPGGMFFSSTACLGDMTDLPGMAGLAVRHILPLGGKIGVLPRMERFTRDTLIHRIEAAGFEIRRTWQPDDDASKALFIVAAKPEASAA